MARSASPRIAAPLGDVVTDRLRLSRVGPTHVPALARVFAEPAVWEFPFGRGMDERWTSDFVDRAAEHWARHGFGLWIAHVLPDEETIGYLGLSMPAFLAEIVPPDRMPSVEVGWRLHPDHWGRGYATEGARAALREAFDTLDLDEVCSAPQSINPRSARVARRIGMHHERAGRLAATDAREAVDVDLYRITREQWLRPRRSEPADPVASPSAERG